jgi:hypothetical protein
MAFAGRLGILLLILGMASAPVGADPIQVTAGTLTWDATSALAIQLHVTGEQGLAIHAGLDPFNGVNGPIDDCYFRACLPGETLSLMIDRTTEAFGSASIGGETFPIDIGTDITGSLNVLFDGNLIVPAFTGDLTGSASAAFVFDGLLFFPEDPCCRSPLELAGSGIATLQFAWAAHPEGVTAWNLQNMRYEFSEAAPVPEPTTLVLVSTGVAGLILRRRRNASSGRYIF